MAQTNYSLIVSEQFQAASGTKYWVHQFRYTKSDDEFLFAVEWMGFIIFNRIKKEITSRNRIMAKLDAFDQSVEAADPEKIQFIPIEVFGL